MDDDILVSEIFSALLFSICLIKSAVLELAGLLVPLVNDFLLSWIDSGSLIFDWLLVRPTPFFRNVFEAFCNEY